MNSFLEIGEPIVIPLQSNWFENGYYVYTVVINYQNENYFYIGMTGDRKHVIARSPFYRMSGHFQLGKSTQNQIIKGIERVFSVSAKDDNVLTAMNFTYYAWKIKPFVNSITSEEHHLNRIVTEKIESNLIVLCQQHFGTEKVFNYNKSRKDFTGYETETKNIFNQLLAKIELPKDGE